FHRTSRIHCQGRNEDINIVSGLEVQFGRGRSRSWDGHLYNRWGFSARSGFRTEGFFGLAVASRNFWSKSGEKIRRLTTAKILVFQNSIPWVTFVSRFEYLSDSRIDSLDHVILDENTGVRGYPVLFASGDRRIVGNLEARFFSGITIFTSRLGGILHFDFGSIWDETEALSDSRLIWSAGTGLRIDLGQAGNGRTARFDLSYAESLETWVISMGIGQYVK
ncbi:MAG: hypothetical protein IIB00_11325, partial [candidate division Zixibacteria bacterium]|nr:hypothetical protein [candidate division Zixibacteria bacterium]